MLKIKTRKNQTGSVIIQAIVSFAIFMILVVGLVNLIKEYQLRQQQIALQNVFSTLQNNFTKILRDKNAWRFTVEDTAVNNPNLACIKNQTACSAALISLSYAVTNDRIVLRDGANTVFYNGKATNTGGFTIQGNTCTGFSYVDGAGNNSCPIGYIVSWRALSAAANPQIVITAKLVYNPASTNSLKSFFYKPANSTIVGNYDVVVYKQTNPTY